MVWIIWILFWNNQYFVTNRSFSFVEILVAGITSLEKLHSPIGSIVLCLIFTSREFGFCRRVRHVPVATLWLRLSGVSRFLLWAFEGHNAPLGGPPPPRCRRGDSISAVSVATRQLTELSGVVAKATHSCTSESSPFLISFEIHWNSKYSIEMISDPEWLFTMRMEKLKRRFCHCMQLGYRYSVASFASYLNIYSSSLF